ncbi:hypothetical protein [Clostridium phage CP3]|nr:hypothetical protein [Clostridium phage CP3]
MNNKKFQETLEQLKEELEIQGVEFNDENDLIAAVEYIIEYDYPQNNMWKILYVTTLKCSRIYKTKEV